MLASRFKKRETIRGASKLDRMSFLFEKKEKRDERTRSYYIKVYVYMCTYYVVAAVVLTQCARCTIMHYKSRFVILYFFSSNYAAELSINCSLKIFLYSLFILTPLMTATLALSLNTCTHGVPIIPADSAISGSSAMSIST